MKLLDEYLILQEKLFKYFNYLGEPYPVDDRTEFHWLRQADTISYACNLADIDNGEDWNQDLIIEQHIGQEYSMFLVDTGSRESRWLAVYKNSLEAKS